MTNALELTKDNSKDIMLDVMANIAPALDKNSKIDTKSNFNNVINNLNSRAQNVKTKFEKLAVKSNTSSINKEALHEKIKQKDTLTPREKDVSLVGQDSIKKLPKMEDDKKEVVVSFKEEYVDNSKKEIDKNDTTNTIQFDDKKSENNKNSFPSPSPVCSSEEENQVENIQEDELDVQKEIENFLTTVTLTQDINLENNMLADVEEQISSLESISQIQQSIEEITNFLDNSSLSQEDKQQLTDLIKDIQNTISQENIDFDSMMSEVKNKLTELTKDTLFDILSQPKKVEINSQLQDLIINSKKLENNFFEKDLSLVQENNIKDIDLNIDIEIQQDINDIKNLILKLENSKLSDEEIINIDVDKIDSINQKFENIIDSIVNNKVELNDLTKQLDDIKKDLVENFDINLNDTQLKDSFTSEMDFSKEDVIKTFEKLENILSQNEIKTEDKQDLTEILDVLKKLENTDFKIDEDIKQEVQTLLSQKESKTELDNFQSEVVKNISRIVDKISVDQKLSSEIKNAIQNIEKGQDNATNLSVDESLNFDFVDDLQLNTNSKDLKIEVNGINDMKVDKNFVYDKKSFVQDALKEIMMKMDYETNISNVSTPLSVTDEIVKLSMDEPTSLNIDTNFKGSVIYDSASGNGSLIKNLQMPKVQNQTEFIFDKNNVLGQITDKIQTLKDNSGQKLTMVLRPLNLGRVSIELNSNHMGLTTNILAQNEDVRNFIEKNIDSLRQQLSDAGVNVNSIQIKTAGQEMSTNYDGNQNFNQESSRDNFQQQNQSANENHQSNKQKQEFISSLGNYEFQNAKDFSSILNKTINYSLS